MKKKKKLPKRKKKPPVDFSTLGDIEGLTNLEVVIALEGFIKSKGLRAEAVKAIKAFAQEAHDAAVPF